MATLLAVNVGLPTSVDWQGRTVFTGVWKRPVAGPQVVRRLNIDGDGQGDLGGHGGEQRAVLVYQLDSHLHWQEHFGWSEVEYGRFGENLTVDGLPDDEVCIGDRYRIGDAEFEVSQPRVTCYRVGMRVGQPELASLLVAHRRPGFYLRVITEGTVQAGDEIVRTRTGPHRLAVSEIDGLLYLPGRDPARLRDTLEVPALSPGWVQSFRELLSAADHGAAAAAAPVAPPPAWPGFRSLVVESVVPETASVTSVCLVADDGGPLPAAQAGQYLTVRVSAGGAGPAVRSYSLSSAPGAARYRISVKQEQHGLVSAYVHSQLRAGSRIDVAAPRGEFVLDERGRSVLLLSAGVGVTPVLAMLQRLAVQPDPPEVWWVHAARTAAEHAFADEAHRLLQDIPNAHERIFYSAGSATPDDRRITLGRPTRASLAELGLPAHTVAYICGPAGFMTGMTDALTSLGLAPEHIRTELFGALPAINPGVEATVAVRPHQPRGEPGTGPDVTFVRSGLTVPWDDRRGSLLELAESCDVPTRFSCRTGVCHTCVTPVLTGGVTYSPEPLELPATSSVLICCARPEGALVLDL